MIFRTSDSHCYSGIYNYSIVNKLHFVSFLDLICTYLSLLITIIMFDMKVVFSCVFNMSELNTPINIRKWVKIIKTTEMHNLKLRQSNSRNDAGV